jgi:hypothetical protein
MSARGDYLLPSSTYHMWPSYSLGLMFAWIWSRLAFGGHPVARREDITVYCSEHIYGGAV